MVSDGFLTQSNDFTSTLVENTGIILPAVDASSDLTALVFKNTLSGVDGQLVGIEGVVLLFSSSGTLDGSVGAANAGASVAINFDEAIEVTDEVREALGGVDNYDLSTLIVLDPSKVVTFDGQQMTVFEYLLGHADSFDGFDLYSSEAEMGSFYVDSILPPPVFEQKTYTFVLEENQTAEASPIYLGVVAANTLQNDQVSYSFQGGVLSERGFVIDNVTGEIVYAGAGVDYENFSSLFVVEASIGGAVGLAEVKINVTDVNELNVESELVNQEFFAGDSAIFLLPVGSFVDPEKDNLTYTVTLDDVAPPSWFSYVDGRFSITDQSVEGVYKVTVVVSDGFLTQSNDFTLTLVENTGIILPAVDASSDLTAHQHQLVF